MRQPYLRPCSRPIATGSWYHGRLSDLLNRDGIRFIPLVNATVSGRNGEQPEHRPFIAVAREHIQIAYEATDH